MTICKKAEKTELPAAPPPKEDDHVEALSFETPAPSREAIQRLQEAMLPIQCELPPPTHHFAPGIYMRELTVPKGMLIVGKIHLHDHFLLVMSGKALVISEFGRDLVEGGQVIQSKAGIKRVALAIEDTKFLAVHPNPTNTTDLKVIEAENIEPETLGLNIEPEFLKEALS